MLSPTVIDDDRLVSEWSSGTTVHRSTRDSQFMSSK